MDTGRIESVRRLIEQQQLRVGEQRPTDAKALAHAKRVAANALVRPLGQANPLQRPVDAGLGLGATDSRGDLKVLAPGQKRVEARLLHDRADVGERRAALTRHTPTQHAHRAGGRRRQAEQHPNQRRLSGSVRAEIAERGAARDSEIDAVHGDPVAEALRQASCLDDIRSSGHGSPG